MKRTVTALLALCLLLCGCSKSEPESVHIPNPWSDHATLVEAEEAAGFELGISTQFGTFRAEVFRTMGGLLEVIYKNSNGPELRIRKSAGEGQDISGDYSNYAHISTEEIKGMQITLKSDGEARLISISGAGYSWSVSARSGFGDTSADEIIAAITARI